MRETNEKFISSGGFFMEKEHGAIFEQGKQSIKIPIPIYIRASASVAGTKEGEGPFGDLFDVVGIDDKFGCDTWEEAESTLQKEALQMAIGKAGLKNEDIRFLFAGDLLGQSIASSFGLGGFHIPLMGMYGACSTCGLSLSAATIVIAGGMARYTACVTSSHFASAEKEFRFPLAYGNQRPLSSTWTVTGSGAFVVSSEKSDCDRAMITGLTIGKIMDFGLKDSMNMGACMAPAAADTIYTHMMDFGTTPDDYDKIITGDLGYVGQKALFDMMREKNLDISKVHMDCGIEIYDSSQDAHAGGSGCGCSAVTLSAYILKQLEEGIWKRVLFVPTGALLSKTSFNEGQSIPGIAHGVELVTCKQ